MLKLFLSYSYNQSPSRTWKEIPLSLTWEVQIVASRLKSSAVAARWDITSTLVKMHIILTTASHPLKNNFHINRYKTLINLTHYGTFFIFIFKMFFKTLVALINSSLAWKWAERKGGKTAVSRTNSLHIKGGRSNNIPRPSTYF